MVSTSDFIAAAASPAASDRDTAVPRFPDSCPSFEISAIEHAFRKGQLPEAERMLVRLLSKLLRCSDAQIQQEAVRAGLQETHVLTQATELPEPVVEIAAGTTVKVTLELLGLTLHDLARPLEAADVFERASLIGPINDASRVALASCYRQLRRHDLARELYLQLALKRQLSADLMLLVAAGLDALGSPDLALKVCQWLLDRDETNAQAYYDMAYYASRQKAPALLVESLIAQAERWEPNNLNYRLGLICFWMTSGMSRRAAEALLQLREDQVDRMTDVRALDSCATLLLRAGHGEKAALFRQRITSLSKPPSSDMPITLPGGRTE